MIDTPRKAIPQKPASGYPLKQNDFIFGRPSLNMITN